MAEESHPSDGALAKRLYAMLELEEAADADDLVTVDAMLDRIHSAAGPVAAVVVPERHVARTSDLLHRTRTLVSVLVKFDDDGLERIRCAVCDGASECDVILPDGVDVDIAGIVQAAERRKVKVRSDRHLPEACRLQDFERFAFAGAAFVSVSLVSGAAHDDVLRDALRAIRSLGTKTGVKVEGCTTFDECRAAYDLIAREMGEPWIWPGTVRIAARRDLQDDLVVRLRHAELRRPVGCGVRRQA